MELPVASDVSPAARHAHVLDRYLDVLDLGADEAKALRERIATRADTPTNAAEALAAMHAELARHADDEQNTAAPARVSVRARIARALAERTLGTRPLARRDSGLAT